MNSIKWEHAGVLVEDDRIKNWESAEIFGITQKVKEGDPWPEVLKMIGDEGWELCAAEAIDKDTRFWFKRQQQVGRKSNQ